LLCLRGSLSVYGLSQYYLRNGSLSVEQKDNNSESDQTDEPVVTEGIEPVSYTHLTLPTSDLV